MTSSQPNKRRRHLEDHSTNDALVAISTQDVQDATTCRKDDVVVDVPGHAPQADNDNCEGGGTVGAGAEEERVGSMQERDVGNSVRDAEGDERDSDQCIAEAARVVANEKFMAQCKLTLESMKSISTWHIGIEKTLGFLQDIREFRMVDAQRLQLMVSSIWPQVLCAVMGRDSISMPHVVDLIESSIDASCFLLETGFEGVLIPLKIILNPRSHIYSDTFCTDLNIDALDPDDPAWEFFLSYDTNLAAMPHYEYGSLQPKYIGFVNRFLARHGMDFIVRAIESFSVPMLHPLANVVLGIVDYMTEPVVETVFVPFFSAAVRRFFPKDERISGVESMDRQIAELVLQAVRRLSWRLRRHSHSFVHQVQNLQLEVAHTWLKSAQLDRRVAGIIFIVQLIEHTMVDEQKRAGIGSASSTSSDIGDIHSYYLPLPSSQTLPWLRKNRILDLVLASGNHIQIVSRSEVLINYLAAHGQLCTRYAFNIPIDIFKSLHLHHPNMLSPSLSLSFSRCSVI